MDNTANTPLLLLRSPLGDDTLPYQVGTLHAIALTAREKLSQPFEIDLTVVSTEQAIDPNVLLHQSVAVTVRRINGIDRYFHGLVSSVSAVGVPKRDRWQYELKVVPRLWFMSQTVDCRIFQQRTAVEILGTLFSDHGIGPVDFRIFGLQAVREYTTQYNETDLDFAHRLLQEAGYFYFFEHTPSNHTLVIADANEAFKFMGSPQHRISYAGNNVDVFNEWKESLTTTFGHIRLQDYNPKTPSSPILGQQATALPTAGSPLRDIFRWPAMTLQNEIAADRARFRMQAAEVLAGLRRGHGFDPNLCPGFRFVLAVDPFSREEQVDHVAHSTVHRAFDDTWIAGSSGTSWDTDFTCFLQSTPWREEFSVARPAMTGIFSAVVLTPEGEEIHADELARVKVRPLFDYRKETVASLAIWVRIMNAWSGKRWGWQHLPRVGTEVGLSFMNGDPDNPVLVGCFYNENYQPVFEVPNEQTKQGFRSRSTPGGGSQEYNELSFDDKRGEERVLLHAQKDHKVEVEHNQDSTIGNDRTVTTNRNDSLVSTLGNITVTAEAGCVTITALESIRLVCGTSSITLMPELIVIESVGAVIVQAALDITLDAGVDANMTAGVGIQITATSDVNITGALVTIEALEGPGVVCLPAPI